MFEEERPGAALLILYLAMMAVTRELDTISLTGLARPQDASHFLLALKEAENAGFETIQIDCSELRGIFPIAAVPFAGLVDFFRRKGVEIIRVDNKSDVLSTHLFEPVELNGGDRNTHLNVLNKVWRFKNSSEVAWLVDSFVKELSKTDQFENGVLIALEWCLNEVMDNVIQHSGVDCGFVMGQIHKNSKHIAFTVYDYGKGIYNTLKASKHLPRTVVDAITLAVQEGVTRDKAVGQGNGMYGLHQIVRNNEGQLTITSGSGSYVLGPDSVSTYDRIPCLSPASGCTTVDFQLDYFKRVSLEDALKFSGRSYSPVNLRAEGFENDYGEMIYLIRENANGFGTRQAGERVRNEVVNLHRETGKAIILDFDGVELVSSSFADELVGKLVIEFGFFGFNNLIRLRGMNTLVQGLVQRSVSQRMAESLNDQSS